MAEKIAGQLAPMCERIEIAGSIRRGREWCNDIDLVILPKPGQRAAIKARCAANSRVVTDGEQNYILELRDATRTQLDIFFARPPFKDLLQTIPGNFGSLLVCRTGSREHNIYLVEHAKRLGLVWKPYAGVFDGDGCCLASEEEVEIFAALELEFIEPARRER